MFSDVLKIEIYQIVRTFLNFRLFDNYYIENKLLLRNFKRKVRILIACGYVIEEIK